MTAHYHAVMYRDDVCAVCGESLPPDHFYCREHAVDVDERLHEIAEGLPATADGVAHLAELVRGIAEETWDYVAEADPHDPVWPPGTRVTLRVDPEQIDVDVDSEPGYVRVDLRLGLTDFLAVARAGLDSAREDAFLRACAEAKGANVTH